MNAKRIIVDGLAKIEVNGKIVEPCAFMTYRPDARIFADFQKAGIPFASFGAYAPDHGINHYAGLFPMAPHFWVGEDTYDFSEIDRTLEMLCPTGKEAYVFPRVYLDTPSWWDEAHPEELCLDDEGIALHQSFASTRWLEDATRALHALMDHVNASKWSECVVGYHIAAGGTEEWTYHAYTNGDFHLDFSKPNQRAFGKWLEKKYQTLDAWSRAWGKPCADFSAPEFPSILARCYATNGALRDPAREMQAIDFGEYTSDIFADAILHLCHAVKEHSDGTRLAGVFYGYNVFLIHPDKGHFALSKVLSSPDVDFVAATGYRPEPGAAWSTNATIASARLHQKLFFCEGDIRTHLSRNLAVALPHVVSKNDYYTTPVWRPLASPELTVSALKKASARVLTEGAAVWWFDMFGGAFDDPRIMQLFENFADMMEKRTVEPLLRDVAYIINEKGFSRLRRQNTVAAEINREQIHSLSKMGAPCDMYEAQDLLCDDFPADRYKLLILSGFYAEDAEMKAAIEQKLCRRGKTLLWLQFSNDAMTGIPTSYDPYQKPMRACFEGVCFPESPASCPRFTEAALDGAYPLAFFEDDYTPAVIAKEGDRGCHIVSLLPNLPSKLLREIATLASAHVYTTKDDVIYAGGNYVAIHACSEGEKRIYLPLHVKALVDTDTGERPYLHDGIFTDIKMKQFETRLFRIEC